MRRFFTVMGGVCLAVMFTSVGHGESPKPAAGKAAANDPKLPKIPTRKELMDLKLKHSQDLLQGIALNNFDTIKSSSAELVRIANANAFLEAYRGPEYGFYTSSFRRITESLNSKAKDENIDGVMIAYNELTLSCLKCHQAMRDKKFDAKLERPGGPVATLNANATASK